MKTARHVKLTVLIVLAIMLFAAVSSAAAANAMPYTEEALDMLNTAITTLKPPDDIQGDNDYRIRIYIERYREIFAAAGYDYEKSMIRIINDIQFERYKVNKATIKLNALARELLRLHVRLNVSPRKYLGKDCAEMLIEFRDLIRSNSNKYGSC